MNTFANAAGFGTVVIVTMAVAGPARAVEIDQLLGRWSSLDLDECQYADDSEGAPFSIHKDEDGTHLGNYGWLCTVKDWKQDGSFLVGFAKDCGSEGGDDPFEQQFRLGLNDQDRLLMSDTDTTGLRRCPAVQ